jgi:hypothetical protein
VRAQVSDIRRRKDPTDLFIAIRYPGLWPGPPELPVDGEMLQVLCSRSPLEIRDQLALHAASQQPLVILTSLTDQDLGEDVLARLAGGRLRHVDRWHLLADLFKAQRAIDPRVEQWLADALIEAAPASGYPPVASGVLDLDTAWRALLREQFGLRQDSPDLLGLLEWAASAEDSQRFVDAPDAVRRGAAGWLVDRVGEAAGVLAMIEQGTGQDAIPTGLVCQVLYARDVREQVPVREATIRLERTRGGLPLSVAAGEAWGRAAGELLHRATDDQRQVWNQRAESLLSDVGAREFAWAAAWSPSGFDQHLTRFANELVRFLDQYSSGERGDDLELKTLAAVAERIASYNSARHQPGRAARAVMSVRLARWLRSRDDAQPSTLAAALNEYLRSQAFVDRARTTLRDGDEMPALAAAYRTLRDAVSDARELANRQFAALLRQWPGAPPDDDTVLPIERVLASVVAPLARATPVLVLVVDGLTWAVANELVESLQGRGWVPQAPVGADVLKPVVTVLPTATEVCRATLLCGALARGTSDIERGGFATHPDLVAASKARYPPRLYHKGQLGEDVPDQLAQDVREGIASSETRVVGVVVNAVDDYLHKNDQGRPKWTLDYLPVFSALLYEARQAGRVVVILSDHGHVLDAEEVVASTDTAGDRWRTLQATPPSDLELEFSGPRVADLGTTWRIGGARDTERKWIPGTMVMPWSERVRYGSRKNGYHGGATPQETVVPLLVLAPAELTVQGYEPAVIPLPFWWDPAVAAPVRRAAAPEAPTTTRREPPRTLFDVADQITPAQPPLPPSLAAVAPDWLPGLLASAIYQTQRQQTARLGLDDERVIAMLGALVERGGRMTRAALGQRLGVAPVRLVGLLAALRRLLNVDGIAVLDVDDDGETVSLNVPLLRVQFEID